jgi:hypothetical protein
MHGKGAADVVRTRSVTLLRGYSATPAEGLGRAL